MLQSIVRDGNHDGGTPLFNLARTPPVALTFSM
jgi:hypothetical protein